jgi:capsular exopolysaccharide synthesis family protein
VESIEYLKAVTRRWKIVLAVVLVAIPAAWVFSPDNAAPVSQPQTEETWKGTTHLFTAPTSDGVRTPTNLETIVTLATLGDVPRRAAERLHYPGGGQALLSVVDVSADDSTGLLTITATGDSAHQANNRADTFTTQLLEYLKDRNLEQYRQIQNQIDAVTRKINHLPQHGGGDTGSGKGGGGSGELGELNLQLAYLQTQLNTVGAGGGASGTGLEVLDRSSAVLVGATTGPTRHIPKILWLLIGLGLGLAVGVVIALLFDRIDTRIRTREQAEMAFGSPVLAELPKIPRRHRSEVVVSTFPHSQAADAYRLLAAALQLSGVREAPSPVEDGRHTATTVLVTSASAGEGKSTTVANLAAAFAEIGKSVVVFCCDLRRPTLEERFAFEGGWGLCDALLWNERLRWDDIVHPTAIAGVKIVPSGRVPATSAGILSVPRMRTLLTDAATAADIVLVDTTPVLSSSEWTELLPAVDDVLVIARSGKTKADLARRAGHLLTMLKAPVTGVALNRVQTVSVQRGYRYKTPTITHDPIQEPSPTDAEARDEEPVETASSGVDDGTAETHLSGVPQRPDREDGDVVVVVEEPAGPVDADGADRPSSNGSSSDVRDHHEVVPRDGGNPPLARHPHDA